MGIEIPAASVAANLAVWAESDCKTRPEVVVFFVEYFGWM